MPWNSLGGGYDDVQDTAPSNPKNGDTWLDTSTDPPVGKVYADLGSGGQWTTDLLDQPVSEVGGVDWASKTWDVAHHNETVTGSSESTFINVSGSGYVVQIVGHVETGLYTAPRLTLDGTSEIYHSDGLYGNYGQDSFPAVGGDSNHTSYQLYPKARFTDSFQLSVRNTDSNDYSALMGVLFALD